MYISVRVVAGAKKERVEVLPSKNPASPEGGRLKISVKEPAEQNLANKRVLELVAKHLKLPKNKVRLIKGSKTPSKIFEVSVL